MENTSAIGTMTVPIFAGGGRIEYGKKEIPVPGPGQLLLKVKANALCGSDRGQFEHGTRVVPGHEAAGIVIAAGEGTAVREGAHGVVFLMDFCGSCRNCKSGFSNLCLSKRADYGFSHDGGYAPYMLVNENVFFEMDPSIPMAEATMLLDIMGTGGHAVNRGLQVLPHIGSAVIAGAGPIGLGVLAMIKLLLGAETPVFIMDFNEYRLQLAERMGAIPVYLGRESVRERLDAMQFEGVDLAVDTSGRTVARQTALNCLNKPGALVCVGHGEELHLNVSGDLIATERTVLGSEYFQYKDLQDNHERLLANLPYLQQIITHRFPQSRIQEAYELFFQGDTGKVIIEQ
ncbi:alcohol dehydrogenase catalytic domain-containing protein [Paenibacillus sp. BC26]|uniref:alcohol dehydrogenase catalytic domain-containing protein n=1 Tax=Paenibacillus sp. BC26 TaxID=1881032 RepID=UPI0008EA8C25|nr:alcohol dehydrogenase catalytic domain-containing protein [Paenibacillus sp. BC26]SFT19498.1 Threonine dehydrogenase [Paenibacillus sp. BC26]